MCFHSDRGSYPKPRVTLRDRSVVYSFLAPVLALALIAAPLLAQNDEFAAPLPGMQRPMITREQLRASLAEIQQQLASSGYSASLRSSKRAEAAAIQERLSNGDIRVGDVIALQVSGDPIFNRTYIVTPATTIVLPGGSEISLKGKLRSEVQPYLNEKFGELVVKPVVLASITVRLSLEGNVNKPCFACNVDPGEPLSEFLQGPGGGPGSKVDLDHSQIRRGGRVIIDGPEFVAAIRDGMTIDQLNLQGGDDVFVETKPSSGVLGRVVGVVTGAIGLIYLATRIR